MAYAEKIVTPENIVPIPIPGFMNTFQRTNTDEEKKSVQDNYGRKTRTPAPKVDKQRKNSDSRRRSGESVEETQFTNANN